MEYRLQMTVSETVHTESMAVRVFISARDDDGARQTAQVWECSIEKPYVDENTDPLTWIANIVALAGNQIHEAFLRTLVEGQAGSMGELFIPQNFLRVTTWPAYPPPAKIDPVRTN